jgi:hypothetical protein
MDSWFNDDMEEALLLLSLEEIWDENAFPQLWERLKLRRRKKKKAENEEEVAEQYNVSVYQVLPYPPHTRNVKDFFIVKD